MKIVFFTDLQSFKYFISIPITCTPVKCESFFYNFMESSAYFLERARLIKAVSIDNINIIQLQSPERSFEALLDMFSIRVSSIVDTTIRGCPYFSSNNISFSWFINFLQNFTQVFLIFPISIHFSSIKMIDTILKTSFNDVNLLFIRNKLSGVEISIRKD